MNAQKQATNYEYNLQRSSFEDNYEALLSPLIASRRQKLEEWMVMVALVKSPLTISDIYVGSRALDVISQHQPLPTTYYIPILGG